jgi:hypothetical protein
MSAVSVMGRGTIAGEIGSGQYSVSLDYGDAELQAKKDRLTEQITNYTDALIPELETSQSAAETLLNAKLADLDAAIAAWAAVSYPEEGAEREAIDTATSAALAQKASYSAITRTLNSAKIEKRALQLKLTDLEQYEVTQTIDVWCADYTLDATGPVGTIEVPGEPETTLIVPGCESPIGADGEVTARVSQKSYQSYWNIAALPAWQKYKPTYRFGTIDSIDRGANTCQVTLDAATSTAQGLDINQSSTLFNVEFDYLDCNHRAFLVADEIVIKFENQDWEQPKVIGFKSNPKVCGYGQYYRSLVRGFLGH